MLFDVLRLEVADRDCTPHRLVLHWDNLTLLFQGVEVEYIDLLVRSIAEEELVAAVLDVELRDIQTDVLGHLVNKFHLDAPSDFLTFVTKD